jgi:hypothetical protein
MYCMLGTRPDIAYAVGALSQFASNPGKAHWQAVKRVMRYLQGTKELCLTYSSSIDVLGYTDADWGGDQDNRRSTSGYLFKIGDGAISWSSKKQRTVALSSTEAEYMAATQATKEAVWLCLLLDEIGYTQNKIPTTIMADNQSCIALAKNPTFHARTKHIDIQHHYIRERLEDGDIELVYCNTNDMVADVLTKALSRDKLVGFSEEMGLKLF